MYPRLIIKEGTLYNRFFKSHIIDIWNSSIGFTMQWSIVLIYLWCPLFRIDDIEDNSKLRRGIPVAHHIYGVAQTINSANYIYFLALQRTMQLGHPRGVEIFTGECIRSSEGREEWKETILLILVVGGAFYFVDFWSCYEFREIVSQNCRGI